MDGTQPHPKKHRSNFNRFFVRGLGIVLPTVLTIWLVVLAYGFVDSRIATPINAGVRTLAIHVSSWPKASEQDYAEASRNLPPALQTRWDVLDDDLRRARGDAYTRAVQANEMRNWLAQDPEGERLARRLAMRRLWGSVSIGNWQVLDLIGLVVAIVLIYIAGLLLGSFIGRRFYHRGEELINRVPLVRRVYPAMKQITDFFFNDKTDRAQFSRVVAVEYPRKGLWSVGLVTGTTMRLIQERAGSECLTVFVPSSPTPFTGYVITVPIHDTIDLPISIEDALKFAVSGGVLVPPNQQIKGHSRSGEDAALIGEKTP